MKHLDAVSHAQHGLGRVLFAKLGFPKVKVQFAAGVLKVARDELTLLGVSAPAAIRRVSRAALPATIANTSLVHEVRPLLDRLFDLIESWRAGLGDHSTLAGWRKGLHSDLAEVELVFRVAKSAENAVALARLLGRGVPAIDLLWRWCDGANFPDRAQNEIARQVEIVRERLGDKARGAWERMPGEFMLLGPGEGGGVALPAGLA